MLTHTKKSLSPKSEQLKRKIKEKEEKFNDLYVFNSSSIITINKKYIIKNLNLKAAILIGSERNTLINNLLLDFIRPCSKQLFEEKINILLKKRLCQTFVLSLNNKNNQPIQVSISCRLNLNNLIDLYLDNSPLSSSEIFNLKLEQSFELIDLVFDGSYEAFAALDFELNLKIMNESFSYLFSKMSQNKIFSGMNLIHGLEKYPELQSKILACCTKALKGERISEIIENSFSNINYYYCFELNIYTIEEVLLFRIKNITNFKLEEKLKHQWQAQISLSCRTSVKEEMASALAHEINQPLSVIANYSQACLHLLKEKQAKNILPHLIEPLKKIATQVEIAGEIIHNMKGLKDKSAFNLEKTDINELIKDTLSLLQYELLDFKLNIILNFQEKLPFVRINKIHIMQVLLNLARNSIEALKNSNVALPQLSIETQLHLKKIIVHVRDNGPGIPPKYMKKVLITYFTTKSTGTGVGLALCKTLVENHGGKLKVHPNKSQGAWFSFTLPIHHESI